MLFNNTVGRRSFKLVFASNVVLPPAAGALRSVWLKAGRIPKLLPHSRPSRGRTMLPCSPAAPPATPQGGGFAGSGGVRLSPRLAGHSRGLGSRMRCESSPQQYAPPAPTPPKLLPRRPKRLTNARPPRSPGGDPVDVRADALPAPAQGHGHGARCCPRRITLARGASTFWPQKKVRIPVL